MRASRKLLIASLLAAQIFPAPALGFVLLPDPPAAGFVMNLDLGTSQIQTIGYGLIGWNKLAESALAQWNAVGIGSGPDNGFFKIRNPAVVGNACAKDGVSEVRWASTLCGFSFGDALAVTKNWTVNGVRVEADVVFNSTVPWNAYPARIVLSNGGGWLNDFYRVALHEFGHVAGLDHPDQAGQVVKSLMNANESDIDALQPDDIAGAHAILWSGKSSTTVTTVASTTTTTVPATGGIAIQSYFPFQPGYEWTYQDDSGGTVTTYKRSVAQAPFTIAGVSTSVWSDSKGVSRYMTSDANGVRRYANSGQTTIPGYGIASVTSTYTPPELYAPASVVLGRSVTQAGTITSKYSNGSSATYAYLNVSSFEAENVTVPAGNFDTIRVTIAQVSSGAETSTTFWVAKGVGIVKLRYDLSDGTVETFSLSAINFTPQGTGGTTTQTSTTTTSTTTTTVAGTTTTTLAAGSETLNLVAGWNLVGNGSSTALDVASAFGDAGKTSTVWKWLASAAKWAFYSPSMSSQALTDYAVRHGYDVLTSLNGGEGAWVNAKAAFSAKLPAGDAIPSGSFQGIGSGWRLVAIGDNQTPRGFNAALSVTPPAPGATPPNITTLWAWDAARSNWYFYAPNLDASGGLPAYIVSRGYLDFGSGTLAPTQGFWLNKP